MQQSIILCTPNEFIVKSNNIIRPPFKHGYSTISKIFLEYSKIEQEANNHALANALELSYRICSMALVANSINEPFKPWEGINNFTDQELEFITNVYNDIEQPILKARFADLLYLRANPKNISYSYAHAAIKNYIALSFDKDNSNIYIINCWHRAICLSKLINDKVSLSTIGDKLLNYFKLDIPNTPFINLELATLIQENKLCSSKNEEIAKLLFQKASDYLQSSNNYKIPREYFSLAEKFFKSIHNENEQWKCILEIAHCFELEGDSRINNNVPDQITAYFFYRDALKTYRKIPNNYRNSLNINTQIKQIKTKITESGKKVLDEMVPVKTYSINYSEHTKNVINYVKNKESLDHALLYFTALSKPEYQKLHDRTVDISKNTLFDSLSSTSYMSGDGRTIKNDPPINLSSEEKRDKDAILNKTIHNFVCNDLIMYVKAEIIPALRQILSEFHVTKEFLVDLCDRSPIVPKGRKYLMGSALWHGFEKDFGNAIHLLAPQVEHLIRTQLKDNNIQTIRIDETDNENSLSTLLNHEKAKEILGENLWFEMKAIFGEQVGANLRNEVAHGLLDDETSQSEASVYAWWMILRLIVRAPYEIEITNENTINEAVDN